MLDLNLIMRAIRGEAGLFLLWILSLSLAVSGLLIVDVFRTSLTQTLQLQGRSILTADISVSRKSAWSDADKKALTHMRAWGATTDVTEMLAMLRHGRTSRLVDVRFIEDNYPLVGALFIGSDPTPAHGRQLSGQASIWVAPDLLTLLQLHVGEQVQLGRQTFAVAGVIRKDSSQTFRFGQMAPQIFVHKQNLDTSGLVQFGSSFSQSRLLRLERARPQLRKEMEDIFPEPEVQITEPVDLEQGSLRILSRLLDFLGLMGLITLALGWIGVYYLGRRWLSLESVCCGILRGLGYSQWELGRHLLFKLLLILTTGATLGGLVAWVGATLILPSFKNSLPPDFTLHWSWATTGMLFLTGPIFGVLLLMPALRSLITQQPLDLVNGDLLFRAKPHLTLIFAGLSLLLFSALSLLQARSFRVTLTFLSSLTVTILILIVLGVSFAWASGRLKSRVQDWRLLTALSIWSRRPMMTVLMIGVSAMAGLLAQLVPNLQKTLVGDLKNPERMERPSLFLFDVQDDQIQALKDFLKNHEIALSQSAPFVRGRILQVNNREFERESSHQFTTREEQAEQSFRNRGVNLSYRRELGPAEDVVDGKKWLETSQDPEHPEISVERGYADRLKLKLGDRLLFDVQGLEISATIASLRTVDWDSFEPNFFILFREGILDEAPKTWIMTLKSSPKLTPVEVQSLLAKEFANVTSINVQETLQNITELLGQLSRGLKLASTLCLALGIFVYLMILLFQMASSRRDRVQLKRLGVNAVELRQLNLLTFGGLVLLGLLLGSLLSLGVAYALSHYVFSVRLEIDWLHMASVCGMSLGCALLGMSLLELHLKQGDAAPSILVEG